MNLNSSTQTVFRSFVEGGILLALVAMLSTVSVTRIDPANAATGQNHQPVRASLLPSIVAPPVHAMAPESVPTHSAVESASACSLSSTPANLRMIDLQMLKSGSLEIVEQDDDTLIIRLPV